MVAPKKTAVTDDTEIVESTALTITPEPETFVPYTSSPHPTSLFSALSKAQAEFGVVVKDKSNPAFKGNRYATLDSVNKAIREPFAKYHLAVTSFFKRTEDGGYSLTTRVTFGDTGEFTEIDYPITLPANIQQQGSTITYVRRYSICALLNLVADEDDDGNAASGKQVPASAEVEPDDRVQGAAAQLRSAAGG
jgi:hypothetical protein